MCGVCVCVWGGGGGGGRVSVGYVHSVCEGGGNIHVLAFYADATSTSNFIACFFCEGHTSMYSIFHRHS